MIGETLQLRGYEWKGGSWVLTVEHQPGWLSRVLFRRKPRVRQYVGECTVWHEMPNFTRASSELASVLCRWWRRARYEEASW